jgi:hypothetical protein
MVISGTLPAVRLRLLALKSALKRGGGGGAAATAAAPREAAAAPARHGRALRDRGRPAGTVARLQAAEAVATDESEADAPQPRKRPAQRPTARAALPCILPLRLRHRSQQCQSSLQRHCQSFQSAVYCNGNVSLFSIPGLASHLCNWPQFDCPGICRGLSLPGCCSTSVAT